MSAQRGRCYYELHFSKEDTEAQGSDMTCIRPHSKSMTEWEHKFSFFHSFFLLPHFPVQGKNRPSARTQPVLCAAVPEIGLCQRKTEWEGECVTCKKESQVGFLRRCWTSLTYWFLPLPRSTLRNYRGEILSYRESCENSLEKRKLFLFVMYVCLEWS